MKYYLGSLEIRIGEYEVNTSIRFETDGNEGEYHHKIAQNFWGDCYEIDDGVYYFNGGEIAINIGDRVEVSKELFDSIPNSIACLLRS